MAGMTEEERKIEEEKAAKIEVVMNISFYVTPEQFEVIRKHLWTYIEYIKSDSVDDMFRAQTALSEILRIDPSNGAIDALLKEVKDKIAVYRYEKKKKEEAERLRIRLQKEAEEAAKKKKEEEEGAKKAEEEAKKKEEEAEIARLEEEQKAEELAKLEAEAEEKARKDEEDKKLAEVEALAKTEAELAETKAKEDEEEKMLAEAVLTAKLALEVADAKLKKAEQEAKLAQEVVENKRKDFEEVIRIENITIHKLELTKKYETLVEKGDIEAQIEVLEEMHEFDSQDRETEKLLFDAKRELEIGKQVIAIEQIDKIAYEELLKNKEKERVAAAKKAIAKEQWEVTYNFAVRIKNDEAQRRALEEMLKLDSSDKEVILRLSELDLESGRKEFILKWELEKEKSAERELEDELRKAVLKANQAKTIAKQQEDEEIRRYKVAIAKGEITGEYAIIRAQELHDVYGSDDTKLILAGAFRYMGHSVIEEEIINSIINKDESVEMKTYNENKQDLPEQNNELISKIAKLTKYNAEVECEKAIVTGKIRGEEAITMAEAVYSAYPTIESMLNLIQALYVNGYTVTGRIIIDSNISMANERDATMLNQAKTFFEERAVEGGWEKTSFVKGYMREVGSKAAVQPTLVKKAEGTLINLEDNNEQ